VSLGGKSPNPSNRGDSVSEPWKRIMRPSLQDWVGGYWWRRTSYGLKFFEPNIVIVVVISTCFNQKLMLLIHGEGYLRMQNFSNKDCEPK